MAKSFSVSLAEMTDAFNLGRSLAKDSSTDTRQVVFTATPSEGVIFAVYSPKGTVRKALTTLSDDTAEGWQFFVKLEDLGKILAAQVSNAITVVDRITFSDQGSRVLVTVHEVPANEDIPEEYANDAHFSLSILAPQAKITEAVSTPFPEKVEHVSSIGLETYIKGIRPFISGDSTSGTNSMMCIADDFVFAMSSSLVVLMRNTLPPEMSGVGLTYSTVEALGGVVNRARRAQAKVVQPEEEMEDPLELIDQVTAEGDIDYGVILSGENELPRYLCFRHEDVELFVRPKTNKLPRYSQFSEPIDAQDDEGNYINRTTGIVINRMYFSNLLKKLEVDGKDATFLFKDGAFSVESGSFDQIIPITAHKGELEGLTFKVSLNILKRLLVGDDKEYADASQDVYLYIVTNGTGRSRTLYAVDSHNYWMTAINLK